MWLVSTPFKSYEKLDHACCYLTQLSYPGNGSLSHVLSIHGILFEKQEDLVVLWVVTLRDQVHTNKPGIWRQIKQESEANT